MISKRRWRPKRRQPWAPAGWRLPKRRSQETESSGDLRPDDSNENTRTKTPDAVTSRDGNPSHENHIRSAQFKQAAR